MKRKYTYWSSRGVPGPSPVMLLGNFWEQLRRGQVTTELDWFHKYGKVYGMYFGFKPNLTIIDHTLIKQVMVKDFNLFVNRNKNQNEHAIWNRSLFNLENDDWKRVRTITSPSFSTGEIIKMLFPQIP